MSTRDESLNARERAALANLEAQAVADDPLLARRLRGSGRHRLVTSMPTIPAWLWQSWWGAPVAVLGLVVVVLSLSTGFVVGLIGALMTTAGLRMLVGAIQGRRRGSAPPG
jgi:hypothetical protein